MGRYQDLTQYPLFPQAVVDVTTTHGCGIMRVLSGQAGEMAALRIIQKHIDPAAQAHRTNGGAYAV